VEGAAPSAIETTQESPASKVTATSADADPDRATAAKRRE
jgi:hypothetical protein